MFTENNPKSSIQNYNLKTVGVTSWTTATSPRQFKMQVHFPMKFSCIFPPKALAFLISPHENTCRFCLNSQHWNQRFKTTFGTQTAQSPGEIREGGNTTGHPLLLPIIKQGDRPAPCQHRSEAPWRALPFQRLPWGQVSFPDPAANTPL